jgi:hypothetical protein
VNVKEILEDIIQRNQADVNFDSKLLEEEISKDLNLPKENITVLSNNPFEAIHVYIKNDKGKKYTHYTLKFTNTIIELTDTNS